MTRSRWLMLSLACALPAAALAGHASSTQASAPQRQPAQTYRVQGQQNPPVSQVEFTSRRGADVTITTRPQPLPHAGPPPAFAQLDTNHDGKLGTDEAQQYAPLANDYGFADRNRNGTVSTSEYQWWKRQ
ncbi:MAG TPA: hypothetical protein VFG73_00700 [Rhodanobacteraceae bacterium]|nr:hypothetical protein [Rhodanobacteraceae bacterium]